MEEPMENMSSKEIVDFFRNHVTHKETGRIISKRFNIPYLEKNQKELLDQIMTRTSFLDDTFNIRERMFFLDREITTKQYCVVCGNAVHPQFYDGWHKASLNDVCSKGCWDKHPRKSEILKEGCKNRDEETAKVKRAASMKEKFGVEYTLQRPEMKEKLKIRLHDKNPHAFKKLNDKEWVRQEYVDNKRPMTHIAEELGCYFRTVGDWAERHGFEVRSSNGAVSYTEIECREYVKSLGFEIQENTRTVIPDGKELDIYIEDRKFAIEIDGVFWHSHDTIETSEERNKHINKTLESKKLGIQLLHFWCLEWNDKKDIVKSIIAAKLGISNKIYARKCEIKEIDSKIAREFLDANHLSGFNGAQNHIGLFYNGKLVHVTSFGKSRYSNHDYEIVRSASILNHTVVGGLGKCLKYFSKTYCNTGDTIVSYADRRYSDGHSYTKVGFTDITNYNKYKISYWWIKNKGLENRLNYQKHKLKSKFGEHIDSSKSESIIMFEHGYRRVWDCGNLVFEYIVQ